VRAIFSCDGAGVKRCEANAAHHWLSQRLSAAIGDRIGTGAGTQTGLKDRVVPAQARLLRAARRRRSRPPRHRLRWRRIALWNKTGAGRTGEFEMRATLMAIAVAAMLAAPAMAQDDDQDCDNIMDELKKLAERMMNTTDPKGVGPVCAATGHLLGIIKASREVAAECYDEGRKRTQLLQTFDKASKEMEGKVDEVCK
jgi:hypothetical protein